MEDLQLKIGGYIILVLITCMIFPKKVTSGFHLLKDYLVQLDVVRGDREDLELSLEDETIGWEPIDTVLAKHRKTVDRYSDAWSTNIVIPAGSGTIVMGSKNFYQGTGNYSVAIGYENFVNLVPEDMTEPKNVGIGDYSRRRTSK